MHELEQEILRIRLQTQEAGIRIDEELEYGRRNLLRMALNSIHCKKEQHTNGDQSFLKGLYKEMTVDGIRSAWKTIRDYIVKLKSSHG